MTVLDLIKKSAIILNVDQVLKDNSLEDISDSTEATILSKNYTLMRMFELAKLVINETASYTTKISESTYTAKNNRILLYSISGLDKVVAVKNELGYVKFDIRDGCLYVEKDGSYTVIYHKCPVINSLTDYVETFDGISEDLLIAGLNSYYCLASGLYAEYNVYNAQYVDRLSRVKNLKVFSMPCRSWND
jgi:hypothetical protein